MHAMLAMHCAHSAVLHYSTLYLARSILQHIALYLARSFGAYCTWQRLRHGAGCKGSNHPQANLLVGIVIIMIGIVC